jgi:hypothetical protein
VLEKSFEKRKGRLASEVDTNTRKRLPKLKNAPFCILGAFFISQIECKIYIAWPIERIVLDDRLNFIV